MLYDLQICELFLHNSTISTTEEPHVPPKPVTRQFKYNLKDRQDDSDLCLSAEDQASNFLDIHSIDR